MRQQIVYLFADVPGCTAWIKISDLLLAAAARSCELTLHIPYCPVPWRQSHISIFVGFLLCEKMNGRKIDSEIILGERAI